MQYFQLHIGLSGKAYTGVCFKGFTAVVGDEAPDQADAILVQYFVFLPFAQAFDEVGAVFFSPFRLSFLFLSPFSWQALCHY
ncbi:TPA: hypothetical protein ACU8BE_002117 [Neisseria subflava]